MAGLKEIRRRIRSVRSTKKITYAMKLVSAVKLRKAQDALLNTREYSSTLGEMLADLLDGSVSDQFSHALMVRREEVKRVRYLVIGGSRGLCGAYNMSLNKAVEAVIEEKESAGIKSEFVLLGKKAADYFKLRKRQPFRVYERLPDDPSMWPLDQVCLEAEQSFLSGEVDEVSIIYTKFKSAMSVRVGIDRLLPIDSEMLADFLPARDRASNVGRTLHEPSAQEIFNMLVPLCVRTRLRRAAQEAKTSEHGCRITAMENATKNAGELIDKLALQHNKLRQSSITAEILDIIGGSQSAAE
ncbi:MAG: ATP synthase F1 subunit gamma [Deltaproteobacteria bacterium]|nr:ATP synthase F1 subunit gamma [Deltaproteobacteria bacterium]